ncbi:DUF58 domain-containing protein [Arcticibacterium luteifluviistationis]|uniref:DUF58 domain-containing protein n=1 Tax=Arcticibacterium luteifluviistationis TaxID=1784714 RepID=A0A2Z4GF50_9BACT|nr:DUF58 domain-containing protein [Arcticibacterium luteifluviistationis]AWV99665.1 DUF58 domain-containing protein [Arcticibacterium luteifluviistationis]
MKKIFSRLDKYEIRIRKAVNSQMHGNFSSIFKGTGLEFADLRTYQYGDDVRTIDWITTAKGHGAYVKIFKEEKEQTVFFLLDMSASQQVGEQGRAKIDRAKEICGVMALSAIKESSHVGLYCFSDQKELYLKPNNGMKHAYSFILKLFQTVPKSFKTDITEAIRFTLNILKRKSVIIMISDFQDEGYQDNLKALAKKHDLVVLHLYDDREINLPELGLIPIQDTENNTLSWVNTSSKRFQKGMKQSFNDSKNSLEKLCRQYNASYLSISSTEDFIPRLVELFRVRK